MFLARILTILFMFLFLSRSAFCAPLYKVEDLILDNSDRMVLIQGKGSFKTENKNIIYAPIPNQNVNNSINLISNINAFTITSPTRYVIDIPSAKLDGSSRIYTIKNSSKISKIELNQISSEVVRVSFYLIKSSDLSKFKTYTDGTNIIVKYENQIIDNSIQYKFYTLQGDMDKTIKAQNVSATLSYNNNNETLDLTPRLQTKYYLSNVGQTSQGLILRGLGAISLQKTIYNSDNTKAEAIIDNANIASKLENKTYNVPSKTKTTLTLEKVNDRKIKLTLLGQSLKDYRFVISPDGQSIFVSHRTNVVNTNFSSYLSKVKSYSLTKNANGYSIFDIIFESPVTYDVFELNNSLYIDINNLEDYNILEFQKAIKASDLKIQVLKISKDKTRFIIPMEDLNFSYGNIESNLKSLKLCFKDKPKPVIASNNQNNYTPLPKDEIVIKPTNKVAPNDKTTSKKEDTKNINVIYVPKESELKVEKPKKKKETPSISSMKKVVLDPGHGGSDSGAIGGGLVYEKNLNLAVAKLIQEKLQKKNVYVYMTRSKDETLTLEQRVNYSNDISPDIYVSIHANSTLQEVSYGLETHYFKDDSLELAKTIHSSFASLKNLEKWETKDRGVIKSRFYVINHTEAPSVLIEIGFISNLAERTKLQQKARQEEIADSIVKGILEYLKVK